MADRTPENPLDGNIPLARDMERRRIEIREWIERQERELGLVKGGAPSGDKAQSEEK